MYVGIIISSTGKVLDTFGYSGREVTIGTLIDQVQQLGNRPLASAVVYCYDNDGNSTKIYDALEDDKDFSKGNLLAYGKKV